MLFFVQNTCANCMLSCVSILIVAVQERTTLQVGWSNAVDYHHLGYLISQIKFHVYILTVAGPCEHFWKHICGETLWCLNGIVIQVNQISKKQVFNSALFLKSTSLQYMNIDCNCWYGDLFKINDYSPQSTWLREKRICSLEDRVMELLKVRKLYFVFY